MKELNANLVYDRMGKAIERIHADVQNMDWSHSALYANWLAQSYNYVKWTTRQLALASSYANFEADDNLHWRFIEEAKEEKKHEALILADIQNLGYKVSDFAELPHTSFFYQSLTYLIERHHPISILGFALTLEGYAATKGSALFEAVSKHHGKKTVSFLKLHCEVDKDHFANALPYLKACTPMQLPFVLRGVELCESTYRGILTDVAEAFNEHVSKYSKTA